MEILRLGPIGQEIPAVHSNETYFDLRPLTGDIDSAFFADGGIEKVEAALAAGELPVLDGAADMRIGAPIARPSSVVCVGMNYAEHAREAGAEPPTAPVVFFKMPSTIVGPHDALVLPPYATKTDWEVELGLVIGTPAFRVASAEEALDHVAGYVLANDLSERRLQIEESGGQWSKGKNLPGFTPLGPVLRPAAEVDTRSLGIRSWVNGEVRQESTTRDLIFSVGEIVHQLSQAMAFEPGDLILTGTPQGVAMSGRFPYLADGDVVEIEIDGLGRHRQLVTVTD
ncbi:2-keto-4-pentenoate hydratase/2-oxohepta-3-ene-1,7-dioic acid hydratase in catechol pathway [Brevibacterium sanguinis]|uniref:2-keto-4-pentenoate hydratase/2-oxohepta-3-ene-1,7-dioic acid hydratase in catechol pathway n=2 Tax=Brevibacterium TaxID=1696 RepID=A0A366IIW0_9MICO|nr:MULTISPECIES: fumarylacetoacetate hydrolase family protein [Brevibacterium]RBP64997.1 2-keto-4-pentenoate hydratase/2-oxohepta-3-ene-1,7-dioic acid hydratase in catechol pathway [Brevibacterium sanguinis]RBP71260.1 2-keto-4-pentenoate hydratase/2-oxohepta-3-ene-1,7-dioic acid hydratase in catechol pathway [Brevibacterium celere]